MSDVFAISPLFDNLDLDKELVTHINSWLDKEKIKATLESFPYVDHHDPLKTILYFYQQPMNYFNSENYFGFPYEARYGYAENKTLLFLDVGSILGMNVVPQLAKAPLMFSSHEIGLVLKRIVRPETKKIIFMNVECIAPDLGLGMLEELGIKFYNQNNQKLTITAGKIGQIKSFSYENLNKKWLSYEYMVLESQGDQGKLLGEESISFTNRKLTGASPEIAKVLERETKQCANTFEKLLDKRIMYQPEASVGNGFTFGCLSFFRQVKVQNQVKAFVELTDLEQSLDKADYFLLPEDYLSFRELLNERGTKTLVIQENNDEEFSGYPNEAGVPFPKLSIEHMEQVMNHIKSTLKLLYFRCP